MITGDAAKILDAQTIADMLSGGSELLAKLQETGDDREGEIQLSGSISALAVVLGIDLKSINQDVETCEAIRDTFEMMREKGEATRKRIVGSN